MRRHAPPWLALALVGSLLVLGLALLVVSGLLVPDREAPRSAPEAAGPPELTPGADAPTQPAPVPAPTIETPEPIVVSVPLVVHVRRATDDLPIALARVTVQSRSGHSLARGTTDSTGTWRGRVFEPDDELTVRATAAHHRDGLATWFPTDAGTHAIELALQPAAGWYGRVVTTLGDPLPGQWVEVRRAWLARPASAWTDGTRIVSRPLEETAPLRLRTDARGTYYIPPLPQGELVELRIACFSGDLASEVMRVPLPLADGALPDLVTRHPPWLHGLVLDGDGRPLAGARVEVDRGGGPRRRRDEAVETDEQGRFALRRPLGSVHLRVTRSSFWLRRATDGRMELPVESQLETQAELRARDPADPGWPESWLVVVPARDELVITLERGSLVGGEVLSMQSGEPLRAVRVLASGGEQPLGLCTTGIDGRFAFSLPPAWSGQRVQLDFVRPGYRTLRLEAWARLEFEKAQVGALLDPLPRQQLVSGELSEGWWGSEAGFVDVRAWWGRGPGPAWQDAHRDELLAGLTPLSPPAVHGRLFDVAVEGGDDDRLVVIARWHDLEHGTQHALWGPKPLAWARERPLQLQGPPWGMLRLTVTNSQTDRALARLSWDPWFERLDRDLLPFTGSERGADQHVAVAIASHAPSTLEVHQAREPVSRFVTGLDDWIDPERPRAFLDGPILHDTPQYEVSGRVAWLDAGEQLETGVALCGVGAPDWRADELGAWDEWARPDWLGRFRFEGVVPGVYAFVLYRVVDELTAEVLAERTVTVNQDLFDLDIWAEKPESEWRRVVRPWWHPSEPAGR